MMPNPEGAEGDVPCKENRDVEDVCLNEDESGVFHVESDDETTKSKGVRLRKEIEKKEQEAKKREDQYLYLLADFENYKKRVQKGQIDQSKFANEKILREVLVVLDNLERAILHFNETHDFEKVSEGLGLVSKQFLFCLNQFGISPIQSLNKPFDPAIHQAVGQVVRPDLQDGEVAEEVQKGYMLYDRLIRPSFVMIAKNNVTPQMMAVGESIPPIGETIDVGV